MTAVSEPSDATVVTHRTVLSIAVPVMLSNVSTPLIGVVDTTVVGQIPDPAGKLELAGRLLGEIAVGHALNPSGDDPAPSSARQMTRFSTASEGRDRRSLCNAGVQRTRA